MVEEKRGWRELVKKGEEGVRGVKREEGESYPWALGLARGRQII